MFGLRMNLQNLKNTKKTIFSTRKNKKQKYNAKIRLWTSIKIVDWQKIFYLFSFDLVLINLS